MKLGLTLKDTTIGEKAKIGEITINVQYTAEEIVGEYALVREVLKELPEIVADLGAGAMAFDKMDKAFDDLSDARYAENATEESKTSAFNKVMDVIKSLRPEPCTCKKEEKAEEKTA